MKTLLPALSVASLGFAAAAFWASPAAASDNLASGACLAIADSKVREWDQTRLYRDRMDTMADGTLRPSVMIFTENGMFQKDRGMWRTGQALHKQRVAGSAEKVLQRMGLLDCASAGEEDIDGQKADVYTYSQAPDIKAKIWVSKTSGLPLRAELQQSPGRHNYPVKVSMRYSYNGDVNVPDDALRRNSIRMKYSQDWLRYMATGSPTGTH